MPSNPFLKDSPVIIERDISKAFLIQSYRNNFEIEIDNILGLTDKISIYKCKKSGYRFYYPFDISGNSRFYEELQVFDWYYMPWKWEHQVCNKFIKENDKVLEVGCGQGAFIQRISSQHQNVHCIGLELNKSSVASFENYEIINKTIEEFSLENEGIFNIVCSFQVLEHISLVHDFLKANIKCLKEGGLLVIGVPNNESFIKYDEFNVLNMPPHHMGLWSEESLRKIGEYFNLELVEIAFEPLQERHFDYYVSTMLRKSTGRLLSKIVRKSLNVFKLNRLVRKYIKSKAHKISGHTILVVFKKLASEVEQ